MHEVVLPRTFGFEWALIIANGLTMKIIDDCLEKLLLMISKQKIKLEKLRFSAISFYKSRIIWNNKRFGLRTADQTILEYTGAGSPDQNFCCQQKLFFNSKSNLAFST